MKRAAAIDASCWVSRWGRLTATLMLSAALLPGAAGQQAPVPGGASTPTGPAPTFRAVSSLVLVDVLALDGKTGLPVNTLAKQDFRVFDNGKLVEVTTFDTGAHYDTRPIALWLVVLCNERGKGDQGILASGLFAGKESLFRPALDHLDKADRVGVAHWCDDGEARIDLQPTTNADAAIAKLTEVLRPIPFESPQPGKTRGGELACQRMLRLILAEARKSNPQPLPVIVFLHTDHTGMPYAEADSLTDDILETSGMVFGIKDYFAPETPSEYPAVKERGSIFHYLADETGGQYLNPTQKLYSTALESILLRLHFRYELGFRPSRFDGKRHELRVEFTDDASKAHASVRLHFRPEYIPRPPQ